MSDQKAVDLETGSTMTPKSLKPWGGREKLAERGKRVYVYMAFHYAGMNIFQVSLGFLSYQASGTRQYGIWSSNMQLVLFGWIENYQIIYKE
jgi:hypothetical protein